MTKNKAIDLLQSQKNKLVENNFFDENVWLNQSASLIKDIFSESSVEYKFISSFTFSIPYSSFLDSQTIEQSKQGKKRVIFNFLHSCIETVGERGLNKPSKQNLINRLSDTAIWTIISLSIPGLIGVGVFFGNMYSDKQNIELRQENKSLKDSLTLLRTNKNNISNERPQAITEDTTQKEKK